MFDIGWPELMVIAIVLVVVVGPKDLPRMLRTFGKTTNKLKSMAGDFRKQFDDALKEAELDEVKNIVSDAKKLDPTSEIRKQLDPLKKTGDQIRSGLDAAMKPQPKPDASAKPAETATAVASAAATAAAKTPEPAAKSDTAKAAAGKPPAKTRAAAKPTAAKPAVRKPAARKPAKKATGTAS